MKLYLPRPARLALIVIFGVGLLSGCAYAPAVHPSPAARGVFLYKSRAEVLKGLERNYSGFNGMSGRLVFTSEGGGFYAGEEGLYRYIRGKYLEFIIPDMYGDILFYGSLTFNGREKKAVYFYPASKKYIYMDLNKKYTGRKLAYERLFNALAIFLNLDSLSKIKKSGVFYRTDKGYFFEYKRKSLAYYIYVGGDYLIRKVERVKNGRLESYINFSDYITKEGNKIPLKISVDDYLYNVKIKIAISKKTKVF